MGEGKKMVYLHSQTTRGSSVFKNFNFHNSILFTGTMIT